MAGSAGRNRRPAAPLKPGALAAYLDDLLGADEGTDYCPNGLQVEAPDAIRKLVTGVSACLELFRRAGRSGAQAVLVHHGLFWRGSPRVLTGVQYRRVAELIRGEISLFAYHLPLDRHPKLGNNAVAAQLLGLAEVEPFAEHEGLPIGRKGLLPAPLSAEQLASRCAAVFRQEPLLFPFGPEEIRRVGIVSGAASGSLHDAVSEGLDAFITGEPSEWVMNLARESRTHFLAAGHYATERLGIQALGEHLQKALGLEVEFVDIPNPV